MEDNAAFGTHEMLEMHEIMSSELFMLQKVKGQLELVTDAELKSFMNEYVRRKQRRIDRLEKIISGTVTIRQLQGM